MEQVLDAESRFEVDLMVDEVVRKTDVVRLSFPPTVRP